MDDHGGAAAAHCENRRAWELLALINPLRHGATPEAIAIYKTEPYVVAADVYGVAPHVGRGGWTWYTGSAGWMYRLLVESLLGLRLAVDKLYVAPYLPPDWKTLQIDYRYRQTTYQIAVTVAGDQPGAVRITLDGAPQTGGFIPLVDDRQNHAVDVVLG